MNELHDLLERATDRIESPDLAARALVGARRRRATRRGAAAAALAAVLVVVVALVAQLGRADDDSAPPVTPPTPTPTATATTKVVQPAWDPRQVDDLPEAAAGLASALPDVLDPPASAPGLADHPVPAAVLTVRGEDSILLLTPDGAWRSVAPGTDNGSAELTADGTRLAVSTESGVDIWDLPTGERTTLENPDGFQAWEFVRWTWLDPTTLLLNDGSPGGWRVDTASGRTTHVPYPASGLGWWGTVDPDGAVVESADYGRPAELTDWAGGEPRRVDLRSIGRLSTLRAETDTIAGTAYENGPFSVFVVDRDDLAVRAQLPLRDPEANYSNGGLSVAGLLDDGTVLLRVAVFGRDPSWRLVAWDPSSGELSLVMHAVGDLLSYASDLLG
ncbi:MULTISPECIES: hypothetical protein [unclassified Nocardioides]|uniref:hypothetical protein n=1 Tax=unclassified Nocardioides TaxID=2615069 RepID=UPI0009F139B9|nr:MULTISPECIES: hypothetical protein [unclassified Nocardioides]GAW50852.1 CRE-ABT-2 protein [Nocardioides sp. PD653-B2]GAW54010.1 CRE-ABT-2 protein [Nocardioides sp. PD653]